MLLNKCKSDPLLVSYYGNEYLPHCLSVLIISYSTSEDTLLNINNCFNYHLLTYWSFPLRFPLIVSWIIINMVIIIDTRKVCKKMLIIMKPWYVYYQTERIWTYKSIYIWNVLVKSFLAVCCRTMPKLLFYQKLKDNI